jgi:hypothetical protein
VGYEDPGKDAGPSTFVHFRIPPRRNARKDEEFIHCLFGQERNKTCDKGKGPAGTALFERLREARRDG